MIFNKKDEIEDKIDDEEQSKKSLIVVLPKDEPTVANTMIIVAICFGCMLIMGYDIYKKHNKK